MEENIYEIYNNKIFYRKILEQCKSDDLILFGFGIRGHKLFKVIESESPKRVICICDNSDVKKPNGYEAEILSPEEAVNKYKGIPFIITSDRNYFSMKTQLLRLGVDENDIYGLSQRYFCECMKQMPESEYRQYIVSKYEKGFGVRPDLEKPKTYNDYVLREMLYDISEDKKRLVDKYEVRNWVKNLVGEKYLIPLIDVWDDVADIDFEKLPEQCVLKANHGCAWNVIIKDKKKCDWLETKCKLSDWMNIDFSFYNLELQYRGIKPRILCEPYMSNNGKGLNDYKVFCFNGKPQYIMYLTDREAGLKMAFYDTEWRKMPFVYNYPPYTGEVRRPSCLEEMLALSAKMSKDFQQVRIDWYVLDDESLKFGEMTFSSATGMMKWKPEEWNEKLGELIE